MKKCNFKDLGIGKRMPNDPLFASGDVVCRMYTREGIVDIDDEQLCHEIVNVFPCEVPGCQVTLSSLLDFEMHYNSRHRFICSQCKKPLASAHFLDLHLSETHDSFFAAQAARKPMYRCFVEECQVVSENVSQRRIHCIETHSFPHDFRYDQSQKKGKKNTGQERGSTKTNNDSNTMMVDEVQPNRPFTTSQFSFGHSKQVKSFSRTKPWHGQNKKHGKGKEPSATTTSELMDTLPS